MGYGDGAGVGKWVIGEWGCGLDCGKGMRIWGIWGYEKRVIWEWNGNIEVGVWKMGIGRDRVLEMGKCRTLDWDGLWKWGCGD